MLIKISGHTQFLSLFSSHIFYQPGKMVLTGCSPGFLNVLHHYSMERVLNSGDDALISINKHQDHFRWSSRFIFVSRILQPPVQSRSSCFCPRKPSKINKNLARSRCLPWDERFLSEYSPFQSTIDDTLNREPKFPPEETRGPKKKIKLEWSKDLSH